MTLTKLKTKNQLTIPIEIIKKLRLKTNELFRVDVESNYIKLTPVDIEPRYSEEEIRALDGLVEKQKGKGKEFKAGKEFSGYIRQITA